MFRVADRAMLTLIGDAEPSLAGCPPESDASKAASKSRLADDFEPIGPTFVAFVVWSGFASILSGLR
jgi:hypothetical protein